MMLWIILFCLLGSAASVSLAGLVLVINPATRQRMMNHAISYATGTLLAAAFLGMIPHSMEHLSGKNVMLAVLAGILGFFLLEKLVVWRHCHKENCDIHSSSGALVLIGDAFHNFVDGVAIAAAFMGSFHLGVGASLAVIAHEVPQEVGDFIILLHSGYSRGRALLYNMLSSLSALAGAVLAYFLLERLKSVVPYIMAVSAASFIYIALADLIPGRRQNVSLAGVAIDFLFTLLGIGTIVLLHIH